MAGTRRPTIGRDATHGAGTTTARGRATAAKLREAARDVFADIGYVNARVEDIVQRAEVSHGTFYTYYDNKPAVLTDLVEGAASRLQAVAEAPWEGDDIYAALEHVIGRFLRVYREEQEVVRAWIEAAATDRDFSKLLVEVRSGFVDRVASNLEWAAHTGGHDAHTAASALVAMVEGYAVEHLAHGPSDAPAEAVRTLAAIWYGGLIGLAGDEARGAAAETP